MFELRKIGFVRRASAFLLDVILLAVLTTGFMYIISLIAGYDRQQALANEYYTAWEDYRKEYMGDIAPCYGFEYTETEDGGYTLEKDGKEAGITEVIAEMSEDKPSEEDGDDPKLVAAYTAYLELVNGVKDEEGNVIKEGIPAARVNAQYRYVYSLIFLMLSIGLFLAYLVLEFILPVILKNGQTVGKKVFSIGLVRSNCVKISDLALFARTMVGKFAFETMFPVLLIYMFFFGGLGILALVLLGALLLLNIILFFATKNKTPIHDLLAGTVAVDLKLQMIYYSEDELNEAKALLSKEEP